MDTSFHNRIELPYLKTDRDHFNKILNKVLELYKSNTGISDLCKYSNNVLRDVYERSHLFTFKKEDVYFDSRTRFVSLNEPLWKPMKSTGKTHDYQTHKVGMFKAIRHHSMFREGYYAFNWTNKVVHCIEINIHYYAYIRMNHRLSKNTYFRRVWNLLEDPLDLGINQPHIKYYNFGGTEMTKLYNIDRNKVWASHSYWLEASDPKLFPKDHWKNTKRSMRPLKKLLKYSALVPMENLVGNIYYEKTDVPIRSVLETEVNLQKTQRSEFRSKMLHWIAKLKRTRVFRKYAEWERHLQYGPTKGWTISTYMQYTSPDNLYYNRDHPHPLFGVYDWKDNVDEKEITAYNPMNYDHVPIDPKTIPVPPEQHEWSLKFADEILEAYEEHCLDVSVYLGRDVQPYEYTGINPIHQEKEIDFFKFLTDRKTKREDLIRELRKYDIDDNNPFWSYDSLIRDFFIDDEELLTKYDNCTTNEMLREFLNL